MRVRRQTARHKGHRLCGCERETLLAARWAIFLETLHYDGLAIPLGARQVSSVSIFFSYRILRRPESRLLVFFFGASVLPVNDYRRLFPCRL